MTISAAMVKDLRDKTGAGMMDCKQALVESKGDMELAYEYLRKKGAAVAAKRAGRDAKEGKVLLAQNEKRAVAIEANCETEPVGNLDEFNDLAQQTLALALEKAPADLDSLLDAPLANGETVRSSWEQLSGKVGEKMGIRRVAVIEKKAGDVIGQYSHMGGKIGVLVQLNVAGAAAEAAKAAVHEVALQVAAFAPIAVRADEIDPEVVAKEREIYREQALQSGAKPEFIDRQIEGKLQKFYKEVCLEEQMTVHDQKKSAKVRLAEAAKEIGASALTVTSFVRFELGK